jgi:hypothetical protein
MDSAIRTVLDASAEIAPERMAGVLSPESLEYMAVKQEQQTRLILRDTALYITLGGILTSAAILSAAPAGVTSALVRFFSYAAPAFSLTMFLIYFRSDYYLSTARRYVANELGPRIADHVAFVVGASLKTKKFRHNFGWELYHRKPRSLWIIMRLISLMVLLIVFLVPTIVTEVVSESLFGMPLTIYAKGLSSLAMILIGIGIIRLTFFD